MKWTQQITELFKCAHDYATVFINNIVQCLNVILTHSRPHEFLFHTVDSASEKLKIYVNCLSIGHNNLGDDCTMWKNQVANLLVFSARQHIAYA